jgi:condensin-2 complex subunit G2
LDIPQSHAVLREILPPIGNLIHDKVEKVRLAVVQMLLRIKTIPNIKYYHIVPLDHLTARFIDEGKHRSNYNSSVAAALTSLMINSYFPTTTDTTTSTTTNNTEAIRRTIQFCTDEPEAAIIFYTHVSKYRSYHSIVQLLMQLFQYLVSSVTNDYYEIKQSNQMKPSKTAMTMKRRRRFSKTKIVENDLDDNINDDGGNTKYDDDDKTKDARQKPSIEVMATVSEVICILWESIHSQLQYQEEWRQFLISEFSSDKLTSIYTYYSTMAHNIEITGNIVQLLDNPDNNELLLIQEDCDRICSAMVSYAGNLPTSESMDSFVSAVVASIQNEMESNNENDNVQSKAMHTNNITSYIALLCTWNKTDMVVSSITSMIRSKLYQNLTNLSLQDSPLAPVSMDSKKRRSRRTVNITKTNVSNMGTINDQILPSLPISVLVQVMENILRGSDPCCTLSRTAILSSSIASNDFEQLLYEGITYMEQILLQIESRIPVVRLFLHIKYYIFIYMFNRTCRRSINNSQILCKLSIRIRIHSI